MGNQTQLSVSPGTVASYDAENRLSKIMTGSTETALYTYDAEGRRVAKKVGATTTYYFYDAFGQLMAEYGGPSQTAATHYFTTDYLGSTRMILGATGNCLERLDYAPFGGQISRSGYDCYGGASNEKPLFTGQMRDGESVAGTDTGQDYFNARYFWANTARFTSPDAPFADQRPEDGQSWNMYAYVRSNPLRYVDSTGRKVEISDCQDRDDCVNAIAEATGSAEAAGRVTVEKVSEKAGFFTRLFSLGRTQTVDRYYIDISGDIASFRGLGQNASRLADLVEADTTVTFELTDIARPELVNKFDMRLGAGTPLLPGGATSRLPSDNYYPAAFVRPGAANYIGDPTSKALGIVRANRGERTAHELLGHVWAEVIAGFPAMGPNASPRNSKASIDAENFVRRQFNRGIKTRH